MSILHTDSLACVMAVFKIPVDSHSKCLAFQLLLSASSVFDSGFLIILKTVVWGSLQPNCGVLYIRSGRFQSFKLSKMIHLTNQVISIIVTACNDQGEDGSHYCCIKPDFQLMLSFMPQSPSKENNFLFVAIPAQWHAVHPIKFLLESCYQSNQFNGILWVLCSLKGK